MKKNIPFIIIFLLMFSLSACTQDTTEQEEPISTEEDSTQKLQTQQGQAGQKSQKKDSSLIKTTSNGDDNNEEKVKKEKEIVLSPQQKLLQSIPKGIKVEFAPPDFNILKDDTTIQIPTGRFEIEYLTKSLNDSLIAQEMFDYGSSNAKSFLISHNYQTNIFMKKNGQLVGAKTVDKALFKGKLDKEFLEKSIIKHPEFVEFDQEKNEAIFKFIIGVPNTDWLVFAAINLNDSGKLRIIEILMPEL